MSRTSSVSGLATVQNLYVMQFKLFGFLDSDLKVVENRKEAKKCLREFESLLKTADWQYMGGEDVYEELQRVKKNVAARLQRSTGSVVQKAIKKKAQARKVLKKTKAKKSAPKKKPIKKSPAKKKTVKKSAPAKKKRKK